MQSTFGSYSRDLTAASLFVAIVVIVQTWFMGLAVVFLDIGLVIGLWMWAVQTRKKTAPDIAGLYFVVIAIQCLHFLEEYLAGFQIKFPQLFGYIWSDHAFVTFNLVWVCSLVLNGVWLLSVTRSSYLLVYFLGIASIANGIGHPLLSLVEGGYFPGLITSPLLFLAGLILLKRILAGHQTNVIEPSP